MCSTYSTHLTLLDTAILITFGKDTNYEALGCGIFLHRVIIYSLLLSNMP